MARKTEAGRVEVTSMQGLAQFSALIPVSTKLGFAGVCTVNGLKQREIVTALMDAFVAAAHEATRSDLTAALAGDGLELVVTLREAENG